MPCYQVQLMSVEFKVKNVDYLLKALELAGYLRYQYDKDAQIVYVNSRMLIDLKNNHIEVPSTDQYYVNVLKRKYSEVVIADIAKKKKWVMKKLNENKGELRRY